MNNLTKGIKMNNFKKIGLSALAGSLAMVSANAVEYNMSGGMLATFTTQDDPAGAEANSGKGIGIATDLTFTAGGELDNGYTVDYSFVVDTDGALSQTSSQLTLGMGSLGTIQLNNKFGSKANAIDDISPTAYNETWDGLTSAGTRNDPSFFGSSTSKGSIDYRIPAQEIMGLTVNASYTYDPSAGGAGATKAGVNPGTSASGSAVTLQIAHESGLEIGGGYESIDDDAGKLLGSGTTEAIAYAKFAAGGLSVAYQEAYTDSVSGTGTEGADVETSFMGVAYTAGDVTVSYGESSTQTSAVSDTAVGLESELESLQIAYTMGAMTISAAMSETSNADGATATDKYEENTLAVAFAF